MKPTNTVKVQFGLDPVDQKKFKTESLWAERVRTNQFRIRNSPFFVFGISVDDVIEAEDVNGVLVFRNVVSRSGHSTYRLFLQGGRTIDHPDFKMYWEPISEHGSTFENGNSYFVAADIPPEANIDAIYNLFEKGEQDGIWIFEEGHYGGPPNAQAPC